MKVLVTDPEGYIGSLLVPSLRRRGHQVVSIGHRDRVISPCSHQQQIGQIAVTDLQGVEAVIHTGEVSTIPSVHPAIACKAHYQDAMNLANLAKTAGVRRFIYLSSCEVYGEGGEEYATEESPVRPLTPCATYKTLVETDLQAIASVEFSPTILRSAIAFGASPRMQFDAVLNNMAGLAWMTNEIKIPGDGHSWCPLVHVLHLCEAIVCVLEAARSLVHQQIFNVGVTAHNYQLIEIAGIVADIFQVERLSFEQKGSSDRGLFVSFDKISQFFPDLRCEWNPQRGAQQLLSFFTLTNLVPSNFLLARSARSQTQNYSISTGVIAS